MFIAFLLTLAASKVMANMSRPLSIEDNLATFQEIQSTAYNNNLDLICTVNQPYDPDITGCGGNTEAIRNAHNQMETILISWSEKIEYYSNLDEVNDNRSHKGFLKDLSKKIRCMRRRIPSSHYTCYDRDSCDYVRAMSDLPIGYSIFAFVEVKPKRILGIIPWWGKSYSHEVGVCPDLLRINQYGRNIHDTYLRGQLIHELSHKCGTKDMGYYSDPLNSSVDFLNHNRAIESADSYRYWEANGLCIPNYDC